MDDIALSQQRRLLAARTAAGFETATDAARAFGWNENTYRSHENGERGLKNQILLKYAQAFKISPAWLMSGEGHPKSLFYVEKRGSISHNLMLTDIQPINDRLDKTVSMLFSIKLPFQPPANCKAYFVKHDLDDRYQEGDLLLSWQQMPWSKAGHLDGIVWKSQSEAGLQMVKSSGRGRAVYKGYFPIETVSKDATIDVVNAVLFSDSFELMDPEVTDRWVRILQGQYVSR